MIEFLTFFILIFAIGWLVLQCYDWLVFRIRKNSNNSRDHQHIYSRYSDSSNAGANSGYQYSSYEVLKIRPSPEIEQQIRELAKIAWTTEESFRNPDLILNASIMARITAPEEIIGIFLDHARRIAPGFAVPHMVPRVSIERIEKHHAGLFTVDAEGWVKISIRPDFMSDISEAQAILAHEFCHYILENTGIRKRNNHQNERYTDLCMFVLGLGEIFLKGYKREAAQNEYRPGHKLGYLKEDEYEFAQHLVKQLRRNCEVAPPSELEALKKRLMQLTHDQAVAYWCIETARRKFPGKSEIELYRYEVDRLEWERRRR
jgi:hypothetical protein